MKPDTTGLNFNHISSKTLSFLISDSLKREICEYKLNVAFKRVKEV